MSASATDENGPATNGFDVEAALEKVTRDPELNSLEVETCIRFSRDSEVARVFTAEVGLMRRFLAHVAAEPITLTVIEGDARPALTPEQYGGEKIVDLELALPIDALVVPLEPRKSTQHAKIVTSRVFDRLKDGGGA